MQKSNVRHRVNTPKKFWVTSQFRHYSEKIPYNKLLACWAVSRGTAQMLSVSGQAQNSAS
jgi:hypothetical protein